jgi:hypothetical protein
MQLDTIEQEETEGPLPEDDISDDSGLYHGSSGRGAATRNSTTHRHAHDGHENTDAGLMAHPFLIHYLACLSTQVTSSSPKSPEYFQVSLYMLVLPCARDSNAYGLPAL